MPDELATRHGLAYSLWLPAQDVPLVGGVVILHGAGSRKESHHDYARALLPQGLAAIAFDARGHGDSEGAMDERAVEDVTLVADRLREAMGDPSAPIGLRGSSMGGLFAILAAPLVEAGAVVAICPAVPSDFARAVRRGAHPFRADVEALAGLLDDVDLGAVVEELDAPLMLMHAEGDEIVPVDHSRMLAARSGVETMNRLVAPPGGHHRSIQHDGELQAASIRFLRERLA